MAQSKWHIAGSGAALGGFGVAGAGTGGFGSATGAGASTGGFAAFGSSGAAGQYMPCPTHEFVYIPLEMDQAWR
jgi:hypothetical protein